MAHSESLVPTGLPYGQRQTTRDAMLAADIPLAPPPQPDGSALPPAVGPPPGAAAPPIPTNFDVFSGRDPNPGPIGAIPVDPAAAFRDAAAASGNAVMQDIARLIPDYRAGP